MDFASRIEDDFLAGLGLGVESDKPQDTFLQRVDAAEKILTKSVEKEVEE